MQVIGQVVGSVYIRDIDRHFRYGVEESVSVVEITRSKDLQDAIAKNWLKLKNRQTSNQATNANHTADHDLIKVLISELKSELVDEIVSKLLDKLPQNLPVDSSVNLKESKTGISSGLPTESFEIEYDSFVSLKTEKFEDSNSNIDLGKDTEEKLVSDDAIRASLAKIKKLKKAKGD